MLRKYMIAQKFGKITISAHPTHHNAHKKIPMGHHLQQIQFHNLISSRLQKWLFRRKPTNKLRLDPSNFQQRVVTFCLMGRISKILSASYNHTAYTIPVYTGPTTTSLLRTLHPQMHKFRRVVSRKQGSRRSGTSTVKLSNSTTRGICGHCSETPTYEPGDLMCVDHGLRTIYEW